MVPDREIMKSDSILRAVGVPENSEVEKRRPHPQISNRGLSASPVPTITFDEKAFNTAMIRRELETVLEERHLIESEKGEACKLDSGKQPDQFAMLNFPSEGTGGIAYSTVFRGHPTQDSKTGAFLRRDEVIFDDVQIGYTLDEGMFRRVYVVKQDGKPLGMFQAEPVWKLKGSFAKTGAVKGKETYLLNGDTPVHDWDFVIPQSVGIKAGFENNCVLYPFQLEPTFTAAQA